MSYKYAYWRTDKEAEPGYSRELISAMSDDYKDVTNLDELHTWPNGGKTKTLYQALK